MYICICVYRLTAVGARDSRSLEDGVAQLLKGRGEVTSSGARRPRIRNLYDVFVHVCVDEAEHADTMHLLASDIAVVRSRSRTSM